MDNGRTEGPATLYTVQITEDTYKKLQECSKRDSRPITHLLTIAVDKYYKGRDL